MGRGVRRLAAPIRLAGIGVCLVALLPAPATAATITPTRTDDPTDGGTQCVAEPRDCSLRGALAEARPGDAVDLRAGPVGPYAITQDEALRVGSGVAVVGPGAGRRVVARTAGLGSVFAIGSRFFSEPGPRSTGASISGLTITGGRGQRTGGGLTIMLAEDVLVRGVAITGNRSEPLMGEGQGVGAGIMAFGSRVTIVDSSITGNLATSGEYVAVGGGVYNGGGPVRIVNSTIAGNQAERGGGLYQASGPRAPDDESTHVTSSTVAFNTATGPGGNLLIFAGRIFIRGSIVAAGVGPPGAENCAGDGSTGSFFSLGHNLESPSTQCGFASATDQQGVSNTGLAALPDRSGLELLTGSPAIDAGPPEGCADEVVGPLARDQRGALRRQGERCDIGALEASADREGPFRGCRLDAPPLAARDAVRVPVDCGSTRRVLITGMAVFDAPARASRLWATAAAARPFALGRSTRLVRGGRRTTIRLPLSMVNRQRVRRARALGRKPRILVTVQARSPR